MEQDITTLAEAQAAGWRILAGDFTETSCSDMPTAHKILKHIQRTGGRACLARCKNGKLVICRPITEMETRQQTERRLIKLGYLSAENEFLTMKRKA